MTSSDERLGEGVEVIIVDASVLVPGKYRIVDGTKVSAGKLRTVVSWSI